MDAKIAPQGVTIASEFAGLRLDMMERIAFRRRSKTPFYVLFWRAPRARRAAKPMLTTQC
ncbi:hypothetical protein [Candidatus Binatus sp.]|uniref:hypothetical protein n=1 Tax=Candidatus Binatus sp. TaxID=2811406 RepID=UPI003F96C1CD